MMTIFLCYHNEKLIRPMEKKKKLLTCCSIRQDFKKCKHSFVANIFCEVKQKQTTRLTLDNG